MGATWIVIVMSVSSLAGAAPEGRAIVREFDDEEAARKWFAEACAKWPTLRVHLTTARATRTHLPTSKVVWDEERCPRGAQCVHEVLCEGSVR